MAAYIPFTLILLIVDTARLVIKRTPTEQLLQAILKDAFAFFIFIYFIVVINLLI